MEKLTATQIGARLSVSERTVQRWIKTGKIKATLQANGYYLLDPADFADLQVPTLPTETNIATTLADILTRLEAMEYYLQSLEDEIVLLRADLKMPQEASQPAIQSKRALPIRKAPVTHPGDTGEVIWLTPELVGWRSFCRAHAVSESTAYKMIATGRLPTIKGEWVKGKRHTQVLNEEGRRKFHELFGLPLPCAICGMG